MTKAPQLSEEEAKIFELTKQKHKLAVDNNCHRISDGDYEKMRLEIETQVNAINTLRLEKMYKKLNEVEKNMVEEQKNAEVKTEAVAKVQKVKKEKGPKKTEDPNSLPNLVIKALQQKSTKCSADVLAKVKEWNPKFEDVKIKACLNNTISHTKKGRGPKYQQYTWDEATYSMIKKA